MVSIDVVGLGYTFIVELDMFSTLNEAQYVLSACPPSVIVQL
jgi:hypothetical protein